MRGVIPLLPPTCHFTFILTVISLQTGTVWRRSTKQVYHAIHISSYYLATVNSTSLAVTLDTTSFSCSTCFPNSFLHPIITWCIKTKDWSIRVSVLRRSVPRTDVSELSTCCCYQNLTVRVLHTEPKPRNSFFVSCGWLQVHRFDFFPRFFSCCPSKAHNKKDEEEVKIKFINRTVLPRWLLRSMPWTFKGLPTQSAMMTWPLALQWVHVQMKAHGGNGSIPPRINLSTGWTRVVSFIPGCYIPQYPLDTKPSEPQTLSGFTEEHKNL
jgi:hypothetical protein